MVPHRQSVQNIPNISPTYVCASIGLSEIQLECIGANKRDGSCMSPWTTFSHDQGDRAVRSRRKERALIERQFQ